MGVSGVAWCRWDLSCDTVKWSRWVYCVVIQLRENLGSEIEVTGSGSRVDGVVQWT